MILIKLLSFLNILSKMATISNVQNVCFVAASMYVLHTSPHPIYSCKVNTTKGAG